YLPSLLAELTNSSFPVQIVRVDGLFTNNRTRGRGIAASRNQGQGLGANNMMAMAFANGLVGAPTGAPTGNTMGLGSASSFGRHQPVTGTLALLANKEFSQRLFDAGQGELTSGLQDHALVQLRIAGLLTIYRTPEENERAEETAEMEREELGTEAGEESANPSAAEQPDAADVDGNSNEPDSASNGVDTTDTSETTAP
ncbi:MAG: hypothetical protein MK102_03225, partial [Fuerstiella sp.]|nr:hypothetical protein [Fuerstiella sp.]